MKTNEPIQPPVPLQSLVRPNIWNLAPYSSARSEFHGEASVFLDANENPWNQPYNRYPDPLQRAFKARLAELKGIGEDHVFVGNGSDEAIDLVIRAFAEPGLDHITTIAPSYGMYEVAADINNVVCRKVELGPGFTLDAGRVLDAADAWTKVIILCSPNNPTGNTLDRREIYRILDTFRGIVVIDEAYIDFSSEPSFIAELDRYPRLIILQTLSKAWGGAGLRLGMAFAAPEIIEVLNKIKYPYNVSAPVQETALRLLADPGRMETQKRRILAERSRLKQALEAAPFFFRVHPSDANFLLVDVGRPDQLYASLVKRGVVVRNRNNITLCRGCLRITVGTAEENDRLLNALENQPV